MAAWILYTLKLPARFRQAAQYQNKWSSYSPFQFEVHPFSSFSSWPTQLASCFILRESPSNHLWARAKLAGHGLFNTCCWLGKQPAMNWSRQQLPGITQKNFNWKHIIPHHTIKSQGPDQHVCCVSCSVFSINMAKLTKAHLEVKYSNISKTCRSSWRYSFKIFQAPFSRVMIYVPNGMNASHSGGTLYYS